MEGSETRRVLPIALAVAVSAALLLGAAASASAGTLDQSQTNTDSSSAIDSGQSLAQTFTAGRSGGLDQVDLYLFRTGAIINPITVEIRDASGGTPGTGVLAGQTAPISSVPTSPGAFVPINFPTPASVVAGTQYAIAAYSSDSTVNEWWATAGADSYAGGAALLVFNSPPTGPWSPDGGSDRDHAFKTYVASPASPASPGPTGQRAAALASCKKRAKKHHWPHKRLRKCKKKAQLLPI